MSSCSQNFSLFQALTPVPRCPDQLLPLLQHQSPLTPQHHPPMTPYPANFDIILSRVLNNDPLSDIEVQQLSEQERLAVEAVAQRVHLTNKRPDQYQKLFFKRAFKFAEKEYFGKGTRNRSRRMSSFYHHHFSTTAKKMNIPLVNFYHPDRKTKPGLKVGQKSFNLGYIRLLLKSESFRKVSKKYLQQFSHELMMENESRFVKFGEYVRGVIGKHHQLQKIRNVLSSSKCKVPWNCHDIMEADRRARTELQAHNLDQYDHTPPKSNKTLSEDQQDSCQSFECKMKEQRYDVGKEPPVGPDEYLHYLYSEDQYQKTPFEQRKVSKQHMKRCNKYRSQQDYKEQWLQCSLKDQQCPFQDQYCRLEDQQQQKWKMPPQKDLFDYLESYEELNVQKEEASA